MSNNTCRYEFEADSGPVGVLESSAWVTADNVDGIAAVWAVGGTHEPCWVGCIVVASVAAETGNLVVGSCCTAVEVAWIVVFLVVRLLGTSVAFASWLHAFLEVEQDNLMVQAVDRELHLLVQLVLGRVPVHL